MVAAAASRARAEDALFRTFPVDDVAGLDIGRGFDILTGAPRGDCVDRSVITEPQRVGQDDISFQSRELTTTNELNESLGISASAQFRSGFGSGSASASFARSLQFQSYSLYYAVDASLTSESSRLRDVTLKPEFKALLTSDAPDRFQTFRLRCGDGYIGEFIVGGEFKAIVKIDTSSSAERQALSASMSASIGVASGSGSFSSALSKIATTKNVRVVTFRRGGNGAAIAMTPADIATQASTLPELVKTGPVKIRMTIINYLLLINDPKVALLDFENRESAITALAKLDIEARSRMTEAIYIINHPGEFYSQGSDLPKLATEVSELTSLQAAISERAQSCFSSGGNCRVDDLGLPAKSVRPGRK